MDTKDIFLTVVIVLKNQADSLKKIIVDIEDKIENLVNDYEIIIVDNASTDGSYAVFNELVSVDGLFNLQVYMLTKEVAIDTATWVGLESALGDYVLVFDPFMDDLTIVPEMLDKVMLGSDVVFATNLNKPIQSIGYRCGNSIFNIIYGCFSGINLIKDAPTYRILSKTVINFIAQYRHPENGYRYLPATSGFVKNYLEYKSLDKPKGIKKIGNSIKKGVQLILSTSAPMRLVTALSFFGAIANLFYSGYVVLVGIFMENVATGWISMSLQMSGMFFLISLVLLVLGEYVLQMTQSNVRGPKYHVYREFTSAKTTRLNKLNVEEHIAGQRDRDL